LKVSAAALRQQAGKIASFCSNHKKKSSYHKLITNFGTIQALKWDIVAFYMP
jgi:hypothetical protein